jgi:NAD(P)-dependent dehydrogenase (short-subunit alcohol dehydrogenase family)
MKPVFQISDEDWTRYFETNVMSGIRLARHHTPRMVDRGWGRVVFISSESALHIPAEMVHYGMTKTAQLAVARGLAETVPGTGVTVNSVLPGPTLSEAMTGVVESSVRDGESFDDAARRFIREQRPTSLLGRPTSTDEVANLVVYVASELSSGTTGAALRVDGGVVRAIP